MICKYSYISEVPNIVSLKKGDRIYVVERVNQDWWFIRKKITKEFGFAPADFVVDDVSYTYHLDDSINDIMENCTILQSIIIIISNDNHYSLLTFLSLFFP